MPIRRVRAILALVVVGVFMTITGTTAIYPLFGKTNVALNEYADFFSKTASVYTYCFGRSEETAPKDIQKGVGPTAKDESAP